jgi:hypothetical protein
LYRTNYSEDRSNYILMVDGACWKCSSGKGLTVGKPLYSLFNIILILYVESDVENDFC